MREKSRQNIASLRQLCQQTPIQQMMACNTVFIPEFKSKQRTGISSNLLKKRNVDLCESLFSFLVLYLTKAAPKRLYIRFMGKLLAKL